MKKILFFVLSTVFCIFNAGGAVRDSSTTTRGKTTNVITNKSPVRSITNRSAIKKSVSARTNPLVSTLKSRAATQTVATRTPATRTRKSESTTNKLSARAATQTSISTIETKTGTEYEQCKSAFFTCMDQFCQLKNDNFRRCSCNDRVFKFQEALKNYQDISTELTVFSENLDVVGMDKEQVIAMKTATEGEEALDKDTSASKRLLQAIMNAITGETTTVGGKYQNLNTINIQSDISGAFGSTPSSQTIASYDGIKLYKAVFPQCKQAVKSECTNASLQRATNAYLMAIEQDCNTVETALYKQKKTLKAATYESSAMLDLARIENRQNRNSYDTATCIENLEQTIQSEDICGTEYHKCLDKGQFIDVTTGSPILGVQDFYKLGELLTFKNSENIQNQKLSRIPNNKDFTKYFENKTKKFAQEVLKKCSDDADMVWQDYLDKALLDIYYAQQSKVKSIRTSCINLINSCYTEQYSAVTEALKSLAGSDAEIEISPATIKLASETCKSYTDSCVEMFAHDNSSEAGDIIQEYVDNKTKSELESACSLVVKKCFDDAGGQNYENFYSLANGLITSGEALDWFTLYDTNHDNDYVSPCVKKLKETEGCTTLEEESIVRVFGGFDKVIDSANNIYYANSGNNNSEAFVPRKHGVATEIYNKIIDILSIQCNQLHGYFITIRQNFSLKLPYIPADATTLRSISCKANTNNTNINFNMTFSTNNPNPNTMHYWYKFHNIENICPAGYEQNIDTLSWGICSCWENGNYRSKNGTSPVCLPVIPVPSSAGIADGDECTDIVLNYTPDDFETSYFTENYTGQKIWCTMPTQYKSSKGQLCPRRYTGKKDDVQYCVAVDSEHPEGAIIEVIKDQQIHNGALNE